MILPSIETEVYANVQRIREAVVMRPLGLRPFRAQLHPNRAYPNRAPRTQIAPKSRLVQVAMVLVKIKKKKQKMALSHFR